jgi:hypothetical protein
MNPSSPLNSKQMSQGTNQPNGIRLRFRLKLDSSGLHKLIKIMDSDDAVLEEYAHFPAYNFTVAHQVARLGVLNKAQMALQPSGDEHTIHIILSPSCYDMFPRYTSVAVDIPASTLVYNNIPYPVDRLRLKGNYAGGYNSRSSYAFAFNLTYLAFKFRGERYTRAREVVGELLSNVKVCRVHFVSSVFNLTQVFGRDLPTFILKAHSVTSYVWWPCDWMKYGALRNGIPHKPSVILYPTSSWGQAALLFYRGKIRDFALLTQYSRISADIIQIFMEYVDHLHIWVKLDVTVRLALVQLALLKIDITGFLAQCAIKETWFVTNVAEFCRTGEYPHFLN